MNRPNFDIHVPKICADGVHLITILIYNTSRGTQ
jgi:hypothetical protein